MEGDKIGYVSVHDGSHLSKHLAVYDNDTGEKIDHCYAANDITGEYWVYLTNSDGTYQLADNGKISIISGKRVGNIRFERTQ